MIVLVSEVANLKKSANSQEVGGCSGHGPRSCSCHGFDIAHLEMPSVTRMVSVLVTIGATVIVFLMLQTPKKTAVTRMVAKMLAVKGMVLVPRHSRHRGKEETTHTPGEEGKI